MECKGISTKSNYMREMECKGISTNPTIDQHSSSLRGKKNKGESEKKSKLLDVVCKI